MAKQKTPGRAVESRGTDCAPPGDRGDMRRRREFYAMRADNGQSNKKPLDMNTQVRQKVTPTSIARMPVKLTFDCTLGQE
jgi:hypothetical protein